MKWYIEEETKELREAFEKEILKWPLVDYKKMFGCPCYLANGKMLAGMVTNGIVITKLNGLEKEELKELREIKPFAAGDKIIKSWVHVRKSMDHTIVHFEIPADNVEELSKFYSKLFDWKIIHSPVEGMDYWVIQTVPTNDKGMLQRPGVNGGMFPKQPEQKGLNPVNYIIVENMDQYIEK